MIDSLGDVGGALNDAKPEGLEKLYETLRLEMTYNAPTGQVDVAIRPARRVSACVRGGSCTLTTRLHLPNAAG